MIKTKISHPKIGFEMTVEGRRTRPIRLVKVPQLDSKNIRLIESVNPSGRIYRRNRGLISGQITDEISSAGRRIEMTSFYD